MMQRTDRTGFTLVELLVVLLIIGILITIAVPAVQDARQRAQETVVSTNTSGINNGITTFASSHSGNYPGVMQDVSAGYRDHALGDNVSTGSTGNRLYNNPDPSLLNCDNPPAVNPYDASTPTPNGSVVWNGVIGGTLNTQCLAAAKERSFNPATPRYFDVLLTSDSLGPYPDNPFGQGSGAGVPMFNIFQFLFDPTQDIGTNNPVPVLLTSDNGQGNYPSAGTGWGLPDRIEFNPVANGSATLPGRVLNYGSAPLNPFEPSDEQDRPGFGPGTIRAPVGRPGAPQQEVQNYFSEGDFAYVPILNSGPYADFIGITGGDPNTGTAEDDRFKAGTLVSGYYLFAYGEGAESDKNRFEDEKRDFYNNGIDGFGEPGVDTQYEMAVAALFNGAVFFEKVEAN